VNIMDAATRIRITIGDLIMQIAAAHAKIEELEAELAKFNGEKQGNVVGFPPNQAAE